MNLICFAREPVDKSKEIALESEKDLLKIIGIGTNDYYMTDIEICPGETLHVTVYNRTKPMYSSNGSNVILMTHGYAGWGNSVYKILPYLIDHYHIIIFDLPGLAFSSRNFKQPFSCIQTCIEFFIDRIEMLTEKLGIKRFHVIGHSMGAYLFTHYTNKFSSKVLKLVLLSPPGTTSPKENEKELFKQRVSKKSKIAGFLLNRFNKSVFEDKRSPFEFIISPIIPFLVRNYLKKRNMNLNKEEERNFLNLQKYFLSQSQKSEKSLGFLFYYGAKSERPLINVFQENWIFNPNTLILFGRQDQMDFNDFAEELSTQSLNMRIDFIEDSDHMFIFQKPEETSIKIKEFIELS